MARNPAIEATELGKTTAAPHAAGRRRGPSSGRNMTTVTGRLAPWALGAGIVAPLLFAAVVSVDGALTPGYSAYDEAISYLDLGATGWVQRANFIVFGLLLLAFAWSYARAPGSFLPRRWRTAVAACLAASDLGWMLAGVFVPNAYGTPQDSTHAVLHQVASIIVFLPFALASLIQGARLVRASGWRLYGGYCVVLGLIQAFFPLATTVYFVHPQIVGNVNSPGSGLFNRVAVLLGPITWYVLLSCVLVVRGRTRRLMAEQAAVGSGGR